MEIVNTIWELINEMAPYLLLGFLLAGLMHEFVPNTLYARFLGRNNLRSVINAAILGIPLPLCSCGVIPTAMGLRREGASKGATVSFLIATPQTGVDSIIATYSLMGLPFAIVRPIAALMTAMLGGSMVTMVERKDAAAEPVARRKHYENHCEPLLHRLWDALRYAFVEMMEDIGKWLIVGLVIAGIITAVVPDEWFATFQNNSLASILFVLLFSIPMYLCATGSIPIAMALMMKGLTPGAALVLLMAGPASNLASILVIRKVLGNRTMLTYLLSIITGAVACGLAVDLLLPTEWFTGHLSLMKDSCCEAGPGWFSIVCTIVMILLLLNALVLHLHGHGHCHCHEEEGCHCHEEADHCSTKTYTIEGMNCNHCAANVQKAIESVEGVEKVEVSLQTKSATIEGSYNEQEVKKAVESLGFKITL